MSRGSGSGRGYELRAHVRGWGAQDVRGPDRLLGQPRPRAPRAAEQRHRERDESRGKSGGGVTRRWGVVVAAFSTALLGAPRLASANNGLWLSLDRFSPAKAGSGCSVEDPVGLREQDRLSVGLLFDEAQAGHLFAKGAVGGCLDPDRDGSVARDAARPSAPRAATEGNANHGCPLPPDQDNDGIVDVEDACPKAAGSPDVDRSKNGCPRVQVIADPLLVIADRIEFESNQARPRPGSEFLLQCIAQTLINMPNIRKVRVEGHADDEGNPRQNRILSRARAESVVTWLVDQGVERSRLEAKGLGQGHPIADNRTEEGRSRNRRVQFVIVERQEPTPTP